jgi:hypothetical protein
MKTHTQPSVNAAWSARFVAYFVVVTSLMVTASAPSGTKNIDPKNFEILGISLGSSSIEDVKRILGPAPERPSTDGQNTVMCYASPGNDRTILEFEIWTDPIEFRLFQGSSPEVERCASSSNISHSLSTTRGLKLGMIQRQVITLLGRPPKRHRNHFLYESSHLRPLTPEERKRAKETYPAPKTVEVYEKIDVEFRRSAVVRIDTVRSESW